jgi:hypothetical protein
VPPSKQSIRRKLLKKVTTNTNQKRLLSFEDNPYVSKTNKFVKSVRISSSAQQSPIRGKISFPFKHQRDISIKKDAQELMEYIELEDFCRRSTVADSRTNKSFDQALQDTLRNSNCSNCQEKHSVQRVKKRLKRASKNHHANHLVKTMAITICPNSQIIYG